MSTSTKPTFYTVFSNSMKPDEYLPNLSEEATKISDLLHGLVFSDAIYYMKDEIFTADRLIANFSKYGDKFDIFYFSGHAKDGQLKFSDNFISNVDRMADVININLKNLQLGFFNACETFDLAKKIIERRVMGQSSTRLVMITCGCAINAFLAERFATLFFNHVGRPGTYYDAYKNASTLLSLVNNNLRFREFYDADELASTTGDFDYAFIDVPFVVKPVAQPRGVTSAGRSSGVSAASPIAASPLSASPLAAGILAPGIPAAGPLAASPHPVNPPSGSPRHDAATFAPPDGAGSRDSEGAADADGVDEPSGYGAPLPSASGPAGTGVEDASTIVDSPASSSDAKPRALPNERQSIINADKKTLDILSANYIRECTQTAMTSNALGTKQMEILNQAIKGTQEVVEGNVVTGKVKQLWKDAARILPGVDSKNDFRSLVKVSKGSYDKALDKFFGKAHRQPTVANLQQTVDAGD